MVIPTATRVRSKLEIKLSTMFAYAPLSASSGVNKVFNQLGAFQLDELIGSRQVSVDAYKSLTFGKSISKSYEGQ